MTVAALALLGLMTGIAISLLVLFVQRGGRVGVSVDDRPLSRLVAVSMIVVLGLVLMRVVWVESVQRECLHDTRDLVAHVLAQDRAATPDEAAELREVC